MWLSQCHIFAGYLEFFHLQTLLPVPLEHLNYVGGNGIEVSLCFMWHCTLCGVNGKVETASVELA